MCAIKALVFDFDGLILDTETAQINAWESVHRKYGVPFERENFLSVIGGATHTFDPMDAFRQYRELPLEKVEKDILERHRALVEREPILPGVIGCLNFARKQRLRIGMASSSPHEWVDNHLKRLGLFGSFEAIFCRGDVPRAKPWPDLYLAVTEALGVSGPETLVLEDSFNGSLAAKRAGLWCVVIPNASTEHHDFPHADLVLDSLADLDPAELIARFP